MTVYLVKYDTGSWDDYSVNIHSCWDSREVAESICEKINKLIKGNGTEPTSDDEDDEKHIKSWSNWNNIGDCGSSWVDQVLVNNIIPDQYVDFKL